jgi:hypothetical protein
VIAMRDHHRRIHAALSELGASQIAFDRGRKHPRFRFVINGRSQFYVVAMSPSCSRAAVNAITNLRRLARRHQSQERE